MPRPRFEPTAEQRKTVEVMAAYGIPEEQIASTIGPKGISPKTLRKHFRRELLLGATKANSKVAETAYQMAISGKSPALTIFWLKCRARWRETEHAGLKLVALNEKPAEGSHADLDKAITDELARVAASRSLAEVPGKLEPTTETDAGVQMEGLESAA
jgi:hypothetical protein